MTKSSPEQSLDRAGLQRRGGLYPIIADRFTAGQIVGFHQRYFGIVAIMTYSRTRTKMTSRKFSFSSQRGAPLMKTTWDPSHPGFHVSPGLLPTQDRLPTGILAVTAPPPSMHPRRPCCPWQPRTLSPRLSLYRRRRTFLPTSYALPTSYVVPTSYVYPTSYVATSSVLPSVYANRL